MARPRIIAGIDLGSSKTATVIASISEEDEKIKVVGVSSISSKGINKGQIVNIEEASATVVESIEAAERMAGYNLTRAVVSVGGPHITSQNSKGIVAVAEPEGEITNSDIQRVIEAARAISLPSSREILHVIPREFSVDGQAGIKDPVGMSGVRLEVDTHIVTASATAVRNLAKCVSEMGVDIQSLAAGGLASAESVLTPTEKELGVVLIDIGGGTTDIVIFVEGAPFYSTSLPIGGKNVTNDLAIGLRLPLDAAEKIKIALSEEKKEPALPSEEKVKRSEVKEKEEKDELNLAKLGIDEEAKTVSRKTLTEGIIKPRLHEIFTLVAAEIEKSEAVGLTPSGVVVCGGGARTVGILSAAKRILSMPARLGAPKDMSGLVDDVQTPEFATAVGLILYELRSGGTAGTGFSLGRIGERLQKIPLKGVAGKAIEIIKSFLP